MSLLKSYDEMTPDQQLAYKMGYEAARSELRVAGRDDLLIRRDRKGAPMKTYQETCSCGAAIQIPADAAVFRWGDQHTRFENTVEAWRRDHRHELPPLDDPQEGGEE